MWGPGQNYLSLRTDPRCRAIMTEVDERRGRATGNLLRPMTGGDTVTARCFDAENAKWATLHL
jgi:hypothetical protein